MLNVKAQQKLSAIGGEFLINRFFHMDQEQSLTETIAEAFSDVDCLDLDILPMVTVIGISAQGFPITIFDVVKRHHKENFQSSPIVKVLLEREILKIIKTTIENGFYDLYGESCYQVH